MLLLTTPAMAQEITVIDNKTIEVTQPPVTQYIENVKANLEGDKREIERYTILRDNMQSLIDQAAIAGAEDAYDSASIAVKGSLPAKKVVIKEEAPKGVSVRASVRALIAFTLVLCVCIIGFKHD
jgi:hypothetical protein